MHRMPFMLTIAQRIAKVPLKMVGKSASLGLRKWEWLNHNDSFTNHCLGYCLSRGC